MKNNILSKMKLTISKYNLIEYGDRVMVAVSGGPDSMCLLYLLNEIKEEYNIEIFINHFNHAYKSENFDNEKYVISVGENLGIPVYTKQYNIKDYVKEHKVSLEDAGRIKRYEWFEEVANKINANKIAIAHNSKDNVETIIQRLVRGSGINALKGIEPIRQKYIRPLIEINREDIEEYCSSNNIKTVFDSDNFNLNMTRNRIRHEVLPALKKINPKYIECINRTSEIVKEEMIFLKLLTNDSLKSIIIEKNNNTILIEVKRFNLYENVLKRRIILQIIEELQGNTNNIESKHIIDIVKLLQNNITNKKFLLGNKLKIQILTKSKCEFILGGSNE